MTKGSICDLPHVAPFPPLNHAIKNNTPLFSLNIIKIILILHFTFGTWCTHVLHLVLILVFGSHLSSSFSSQLDLNHFAQRDPPRVTSSSSSSSSSLCSKSLESSSSSSSSSTGCFAFDFNN